MFFSKYLAKYLLCKKTQFCNENVTCMRTYETEYPYFSDHKAHRIIRRIKWSKTYISQTLFNSFTIMPGRRREFNLSHMPNPLDTRKIEGVHIFDSVCANVVWSLEE